MNVVQICEGMRDTYNSILGSQTLTDGPMKCCCTLKDDLLQYVVSLISKLWTANVTSTSRGENVHPDHSYHHEWNEFTGLYCT